MSKVDEFQSWMRDDPAIRAAGRNAIRQYGVRSMIQLEAEQPEVFEEIYESCADLREQAPAAQQAEWLT